MLEQGQNLIKTLKEGGVVVMPTDTIYGILGRAEDEKVVARIYEVRKRAPNKPCIILVSNLGDLLKFGVNISKEQEKVLKNYWHADISGVFQAGPVSIILECNNEKFSYLHRGTNTLAFRIPANPELRELISLVGPLVAPSANIEGEKPAENILEAKKYFGSLVDLYVDKGQIRGKASTVIKLSRDGVESVLRA